MVSIRDIARMARVSIGTVDRVLHNRGRVSAATHSRVRKIVEELEYTPNIYARNLSMAKPFTFGVLMPKLSQDCGYWRIPAEGIKRAQSELEPYRVRVRFFHFDRYSGRSFSVAVQNCLAENLDGLLVAPALQQAAEELASRFQAKIPYAYFDATIPGSQPLVTIGQDPFLGGVLAANLMRKITGGHGDIALVKVLPDDFHIQERVRGFASVIEPDPAYHLHLVVADSRNPKAMAHEIPERILDEYPALAGMFVTNAWTHPFARFIAQQPGKRRVRLIGYDLVPENITCLRSGAIDFLISQRPKMQGYWGILALHRSIVLRQKVRRHIMVPLDILTADNLSYYQD